MIGIFQLFTWGLVLVVLNLAPIEGIPGIIALLPLANIGSRLLNIRPANYHKRLIIHTHTVILILEHMHRNLMDRYM